MSDSLTAPSRSLMDSPLCAFYLSIAFCLSACLCLSLCISFSFFLCQSLSSVGVSISFCPSLSISVCPHLSLSLSLSQLLPVCVSISASVSFCVCVCLSVCLSLCLSPPPALLYVGAKPRTLTARCGTPLFGCRAPAPCHSSATRPAHSRLTPHT